MTTTETLPAVTTETVTFTLQGTVLLDCLAAAAITASTDGARPIVAAVAIYPNGPEHAAFVSTDTYALTWTDTEGRDLQTVDLPEPILCETPAAIVKWLKSLKMGSHVPVKVTADGRDVTFTTFSGSITVRQVLGEFPQWQRLFPTKRDEAGSVSTFAMSERNLKRVHALSALAGKDAAGHVRFTFGETNLKPVTFTLRTDKTQQTVTGLFMPVRVS